ncbi:ATP-binding protein [Nocardioides panacisoli]|uniref:Sensor-like histidine kinase SenX3 n=1 Tax=Nocardioides panacisoli TaxID=627624 RepID=A0ABP7J8M6_9ACTN
MDDRRLRGVLLSCAAAALFVVAGLVGRATVVAEGGPSSLIWPAVGIGVVWILSRRSRAGRIIDLSLLGAASTLVTILAGTPARAVPVIVVSALLGTVATVAAMQRLDPALTGATSSPLRSPQSVVRLLLGAGGGCAVGVVAGALGLWLVSGTVPDGFTLLWWGRNVCAVLGASIPGLLLVDHLRRRPRPMLLPGSAMVELAALLATTAGIVAADGLTELPLSFLLPAVTVWAGSRFPPLVVALHALLGGAATFWLTMQGHGPFATVHPLWAAAFLTQVFVGITLLMGLLLAAAREANLALEAERAQRATEQREALLGFARRAAHDLQGPLAVIDGWSTELAAAVNADPFVAATGAPMMVAQVRGATELARELVSDILADAIAEDRSPARARVDLTDLARELARSLAGTADVVVLDVGVVRGDRALLRQLFANLLDNAVKYVRPGEPPRITVSGFTHDDEVRVRIADLGIGIPEGQHERIFGEFERASDDRPGTGLGLSICRRITERHGGRIRALDRADDRTGAVFEITLPAWTGPASPPHPDLAPETQRPRNLTKVTT